MTKASYFIMWQFIFKFNQKKNSLLFGMIRGMTRPLLGPDRVKSLFYIALSFLILPPVTETNPVEARCKENVKTAFLQRLIFACPVFISRVG